MTPSIRRLTEMAWPDVRAAVDEGVRTAVFAVGSTEQHGPHLPLSSDTVLGDALVGRLAARIPNVVVGPTVPLGVATHHMSFAGTITLETSTFLAVVHDYLRSLAVHGFETILVVPSHGGNFGPLAELLSSTGGMVDGARFVPYTDLVAFVRVLEEVGGADGIPPTATGAHAGEAESSMLLAARPDLVTMSAAAAAGYLGVFDSDAAQRVFAGGTAALADNGVLGDPAGADAERGERYLDALTDLLVDHFRSVLAG